MATPKESSRIWWHLANRLRPFTRHLVVMHGGAGTKVRATVEDLDRALTHTEAAQLEAQYPLLLNEQRVRTVDFLVHLAIHLGYHLGQIDYHRRLLTPNPQTADAMSIRELPPYDNAG